jgi:NAD(P)-dependent dehydrogenase (short-subunit alcohol dehydrogenase family)
MLEGVLKGKSVVIMGSGSGVGRASALLFSSQGARLVLADIALPAVEATVAMVKEAGGEAQAIHCDVAKKADVVAAVKLAVETYGRLDVIYNNVGIPSPRLPVGGVKTLAQNSEEDIDRLMDINVKGVIHGCQAAVDQFLAQGGGGVIVNTASAAGLMGWGGTLYATTKGAVVNLTRALAMEVAKHGIRVNSVCPAGMATPFITGVDGVLSEEVWTQMGKMHPLGRMIEPIEAARSALFLASDLSSNTTGVNLAVDGGMSAGHAAR